MQVTFEFTRKNGAYLVNTFIPFVILELIGLLTLLMPYNDYQDRVTVTLSCLIVMATLFSQVIFCVYVYLVIILVSCHFGVSVT